MASIEIPLPPLSEQKEIVRRLEGMLARERGIAEDSAALDALVAAAKRKILQLAVSGKLIGRGDRENVEREATDRTNGRAARPRAAALTTPLDGEDCFCRVDRENGEKCAECGVRRAEVFSRGDRENGENGDALPVGWKMVRLGEVCDYGRCTSVDPKELEPTSWVLDLEDIEKDTGRLLVRVSAQERKSTSTKHAFTKGTLLYSKLRTYLNKVLVAPEDGCCTSEILPLAFDDRVVPAYARIVMMSPMFLDYTAKCCYGVKMPRLGTSDGRKAPFPLPPLAEQNAIVAKVDELFSVLDAMKG